MANTLDIGIVVPLYNKEAMARRSIERLLEQTVPAARVVVVDDGSTDQSVAQLAPLADRITLVQQANAGPSAARNRGVAQLQTEWVAFADADNLWDPRRLERVQRFIGQYPNVDWLTGRYWACYPDGRRLSAPPWSGPDSPIAYFDRAAQLPGLHCSETLVVRRALFQQVGGFNEKLRCYEITQIYLQLAAQVATAGFIAEPTVEVFYDTAASLYAEKRHAPAVLRAYLEELLRIHQRLAAPPAYLGQLIAETMRDCVYFGCQEGDFKLVRDLLRQHGHWLPPAARWKAWLRCLAARTRGR